MILLEFPGARGFLDFVWQDLPWKTADRSATVYAVFSRIINYVIDPYWNGESPLGTNYGFNPASAKYTAILAKLRGKS